MNDPLLDHVESIRKKTPISATVIIVLLVLVVLLLFLLIGGLFVSYFLHPTGIS